VVAAACGRWQVAIAILLIRMMMAIVAGWFKMRSKDVPRLFFLIPLRDLFGVAVWMAGLFGNTVIWRGRKLRLNRDGRIIMVV
jgi:ceramide glucosyltransferase